VVTNSLVIEPRAVLTPSMIAEGEALVRRMIERPASQLTAAFWLYLEERNRWRLHMAFPGVAEEGARAAYKLVYAQFQVIAGHPTYGFPAMEFTDIAAIDAEDRLVRALRKIYPGGVRVGMASARQIWLDDHYFEGVLIYLL